MTRLPKALSRCPFGKVAFFRAWQCGWCLAAYWSSWADMLSHLKQRTRSAPKHSLSSWEAERSLARNKAAQSKELVLSQGFLVAYALADLAQGKRPPELDDLLEPSEFAHGWQYHAAVTLDSFIATACVVPSLSEARKAPRWSCMGPSSAWHLTALLTS